VVGADCVTAAREFALKILQSNVAAEMAKHHCEASEAAIGSHPLSNERDSRPNLSEQCS